MGEGAAPDEFVVNYHRRTIMPWTRSGVFYNKWGYATSQITRGERDCSTYVYVAVELLFFFPAKRNVSRQTGVFPGVAIAET